MNAATRVNLRRTIRSGFTLAEMLVAVACLALLALGVAQVFSLTTRTVAAGRRLSNLNAVASATERQLRADFARLTREGVLLIHNEMADGGAPVLSGPDDQSPRPRRVDEIAFFAKGNFATMRDPVRPDLLVKSQEAMIYFGHGLKQDPALAMNQVFTYDTNAGAPTFNQPGPNRYAADWVLARRVVVLSQLSTAGRTGSQTVADSYALVGEQPAAPAIFRSAAQYTAALNGLGAGAPSLASGVVDIAVGDLQDVRRALTTNAGQYSSWQAGVGGGFGGPGGYSVGAQQGMIQDILPADSFSGQRMRVETSAPNYLGIPWANSMTPAQQAAARADQAMLTSAAFLPRCTEFIVEYSFGKANPTTTGGAQTTLAAPGATYWHGMARALGPGANASDHDRADVVPLTTLRAALGNRDPWTRTYRGRDGQLFRAPVPAGEIEQLIEYQPPQHLYAFFGQNDPLYSPMTVARPPGVAAPLVRDVNGNGQFDRQDGDILYAPETYPWPWPTMIRITFTLADATDPTIEQTFQFVFALPGDKPASAM